MESETVWNRVEATSPSSLRVLGLGLTIFFGISLTCLGGEPDPDQQFTGSVGGGWAANDGDGIKSGHNLSASGGFAVIPEIAYADSTGNCKFGCYWRVYLTANILFTQSNITQAAVQQAVILNPTNPALLSASSGREKVYNLTFGPHVRYWLFKDWVGVYGSAGFGWLRRALDFTGTPLQGTLIQAPNPVVSAIVGNSGSFDAAVGVNLGNFGGTGGLKFFVEGRYVHGLGINSGVKIWPVSIGVRW